jgi:AraC family transcriptional regulator of adaptative response/methylated-DNA-[protein]-cysteine methyltransferase
MVPVITDRPEGRFRGISSGDFLHSPECSIIHYGIHRSPFGPYLLGITGQNRICMLEFLERETETSHLFKNHWKTPRWVADPERTGLVAGALFDPSSPAAPPLLAIGTPFQLSVWEQLTTIPFGERTTYREVAEAVGSPGAFQAVGNAIGNNHIAFLIPCHRVVRKDGKPTGFRWGKELKSEILQWESRHG